MSTNYTPETDPQNNLRSDLWPTMSPAELGRQQELVVDKLSKLQSMTGVSSTPSFRNIYGALQVAMNDLTQLINNRSQQRKQ